MILDRAAAPGILLLGAVRGLSTEAVQAVLEVEGFAPSAIGIGTSPEELKGLSDYFVHAPAEPVVPLTATESAEVFGLTRFGEVQVPNPTFVRILEWAGARSVPVEALDVSDDDSASLFADNIGYVELVRRTLRERRLSRKPPEPSSSDEFALAWDREVAAGSGSRRYSRERDTSLVESARRLARLRGRVAVIVDRERFALVRSLLAGESPT